MLELTSVPWNLNWSAFPRTTLRLDLRINWTKMYFLIRVSYPDTMANFDVVSRGWFTQFRVNCFEHAHQVFQSSGLGKFLSFYVGIPGVFFLSEEVEVSFRHISLKASGLLRSTFCFPKYEFSVFHWSPRIWKLITVKLAFISLIFLCSYLSSGSLNSL